MTNQAAGHETHQIIHLAKPTSTETMISTGREATVA